MHTFRRLPAILVILLLLSACAALGNSTNDGRVKPGLTTVPVQSPTSSAIAACPAELGPDTCRTPYDLRVAYGVQSLIERGFTGKGQTIVDIVSYGSPTLQKDMDIFDKQFGLPPITIKVLSPLGAKPVDHPPAKDKIGWAEETTLDVQT